MNKIFNPKQDEWKSLLQRPTQSFDAIEPVVASVFKAVEKDGDKAIKSYTQKFDGVTLENFKVSEKEIAAAKAKISNELKDAIQLAKSNIEKFHSAQKTTRVSVNTMPGVACWQEKRPIQKVGLYIPGGTAPLFSTILMLAVPAALAGCKEIVLCAALRTKRGS